VRSPARASERSMTHRLKLDDVVAAVQAALSMIKDVYRIKAAYLVPEFSWEEGRLTATVLIVIRDLDALEPGDMMDLFQSLSEIKCGRHALCLLPRLHRNIREADPDLLKRSVALMVRPFDFSC